MNFFFHFCNSKNNPKSGGKLRCHQNVPENLLLEKSEFNGAWGAICLLIMVGLGISFKKRGKEEKGKNEKRRIGEKEKRRIEEKKERRRKRRIGEKDEKGKRRKEHKGKH